MSTEEAWPFSELYRVNLPPTQIREAQKRCLKKGVVDLSAPSQETQNIIQAVFAAYSKKRERSRAASSRSRLAAKSAEAESDIAEVGEVAVPCSTNEEAACEVVAEVVAEAEAAPPTPPAPPKAALSKAAKMRADNVAPTHPASGAPPPEAPAPQKRAAAEAPAPRRRGGGLCAMVASIALP